MIKRWTALLLSLLLLSAAAVAEDDFGTALQNLNDSGIQTLGVRSDENMSDTPRNADKPISESPAPLPESSPVPDSDPAPAAGPVQPEKPDIAITRINIQAPPKEGLMIGDTLNIYELVSILPIDASRSGLIYQSSNESIASVSEDGILTGKSPGKITVSVRDTRSGKSAKVSVTVIQPVEQIHVSATNRRKNQYREKDKGDCLRGSFLC